MRVTYVYISSVQAVMFASVLAKKMSIIAIVKGSYLEKIVKEHKIPILHTLRSRFALKNPISWFRYFMERNEIIRKIPVSSKVLFTCVSVDIEGFSLIDRLSKFCKIFFFPMDWMERKNVIGWKYSLDYLRFKLRTILLQWILKLSELRIYESTRYFNGIDGVFFQNRKIDNFNELTSADDIRKQYSKNNFNNKAQILLLGLPDFTSSEEIKFLQIIERLSLYKNFLYVPHPRYEGKESKLIRKNIGLAETYIGPETIVIGVASAVMVHAIRNYACNVISILDLLYKPHQSEHKHYIHFLDRQKIKEYINFSNSFEDLFLKVERDLYGY